MRPLSLGVLTQPTQQPLQLLTGPVLPCGPQGVVSTAEKLHALEEAEFAAWQAALASTAQRLTDAEAAGAVSSTQHAAAHHSSCATDSLTVHSRQQEHQGQQQQVQHEGLVQARLQQGLAPGPGPISCYEGRLDFWRQLWRTLEMSDVICMIVDARWVLSGVIRVLWSCSAAAAAAQLCVGGTGGAAARSFSQWQQLACCVWLVCMHVQCGP